MFRRFKEKLSFYFSSLVLLNATAWTGFLMSEVEEVVVTARKKTESLQDVPLSVSALRESSLEEKGISVFEDYLLLQALSELRLSRFLCCYMRHLLQ